MGYSCLISEAWDKNWSVMAYVRASAVHCGDLISKKKLNYLLDSIDNRSKNIDILFLSIYVYGKSQFFLFFTSFCDLPE